MKDGLKFAGKTKGKMDRNEKEKERKRRNGYTERGREREI